MEMEERERWEGKHQAQRHFIVGEPFQTRKKRFCCFTLDYLYGFAQVQHGDQATCAVPRDFVVTMQVI
jgi:hypothetical protein